MNKAELTLALKPREDVTRNTKTRVPVAPQHDMCTFPPKMFLNKKAFQISIAYQKYNKKSRIYGTSDQNGYEINNQ